MKTPKPQEQTKQRFEFVEITEALPRLQDGEYAVKKKIAGQTVQCFEWFSKGSFPSAVIFEVLLPVPYESEQTKQERYSLQTLRNKFKNKYDYNLQMIGGMFNIFIEKNDVDLWDSGSYLTEHEAIEAALNYLNKINPK
jgi:hypothetical protein